MKDICKPTCEVPCKLFFVGKGTAFGYTDSKGFLLQA